MWFAIHAIVAVYFAIVAIRDILAACSPVPPSSWPAMTPEQWTKYRRISGASAVIFTGVCGLSLASAIDEVRRW